MCVIVHCEKTVPTLADLVKMESNNRAGGGIAWFEKGQVHWAKGINAHRIFNIASSVNLPVVIHFRLATVGGENKGLCHPFPITEKAEVWKKGHAEGVLFHNGHESNWETLFAASGLPKLQGPVSDTRALAAITGRNRQPGWLNKLTGKFIAMFENRGPVVLRMGFFTEKDGMFFSNMHWDTSATAASSYQAGFHRGAYQGDDYYEDRDRDYTGHRPGAAIPNGAQLNGITYGTDGELINGVRHSKSCNCRPCIDAWVADRNKKNPTTARIPQQYPGHAGYNHTKQCNCYICVQKRNDEALIAAATRADAATNCAVTVTSLTKDAKGDLKEQIMINGKWEIALQRPKDHFISCSCAGCMDYRNQQFHIKQQEELHAQVEARDRELALQDERDLQQAVTEGMTTELPTVKTVVDQLCKEAVAATIVPAGNNQ